MEEMKPIVTEKREVEYRDESILIDSIIWKFQTIRILMQETKWTTFHWNALPQVEGFRLTPRSMESSQ